MLVDRQPTISSSDSQPYTLNLRHYAITSRPILSSSLSRSLKRLDRAKTHAQHRPYAGQHRDYNDVSESGKAARRKASKGALPDLGSLDDVADFLLEPGANGGYATASESEAEGTEAEVDVIAEPEAKRTWNRKQRDEITRERRRAEAEREAAIEGELVEGAGANKRMPRPPKTQKRAVKLTELGPRLKLRLYKVEEGLCSGRVMWHESITKSKQEVKEMDKTWSQRNEEKERRRKEQRANLEKKKKEKDEQRKKDKAEGRGGEDKVEGEEEEESIDGMLSDVDWDDVDGEEEDEMDVDGGGDGDDVEGT